MKLRKICNLPGDYTRDAVEGEEERRKKDGNGGNKKLAGAFYLPPPRHCITLFLCRLPPAAACPPLLSSCQTNTTKFLGRPHTTPAEGAEKATTTRGEYVYIISPMDGDEEEETLAKYPRSTRGLPSDHQYHRLLLLQLYCNLG